MGLAGIKFSGSVEMYGDTQIMIKKINVVIINPTKSFLVKNGWKLILSLSIWIIIGLDDPVEWSNIIWEIDIVVIANGRMK